MPFFKFRRLWLLLLLPGSLMMQAGRAADIAHEVRQGDTDSSASLELGLRLGYYDVPIVGFSTDDPDDPTVSEFRIGLSIEARAEWYGLFAEAFSESFNGVALGYELWSDEHNNLDLILTNNLTDYEPGIGEFASVQTRKGDVVMGLRSTHFLNQSILQLEFYGEATNRHNGVVAAAHLGHYWQRRNWNLHAVVGARYMSSRVLDYYFGISESESTASIPTYSASDGVLLSLEVGSTLPLNENWLFRSTARGYYLPDAIADSPLTQGRVISEVNTIISYVF